MNRFATYGNDVAVAPRDVLAAGEEGTHGIEESADLGVHGHRRSAIWSVRSFQFGWGPDRAMWALFFFDSAMWALEVGPYPEFNVRKTGPVII